MTAPIAEDSTAGGRYERRATYDGQLCHLANISQIAARHDLAIQSLHASVLTKSGVSPFACFSQVYWP